MGKNLEHEFSMLVREIRKQSVGNGPKEIMTRFVGPWAVSEMKGNLTNVEKFMIHSDEGKRMVEEARTKLVKDIYKNPDIVAKLETLVNAKLVAVYTDINIELDTAMTIYVFDQPVG